MRNFLKVLFFSLAVLANTGHTMEMFVEPTSSGRISSGGLDIFEYRTTHQRLLNFISFYDRDPPCMPSECGFFRSLGYSLFDRVPVGFNVQSAVFELDISSAYFRPFFFSGLSFPNGSGVISINLFDGALVEALRSLPEGELIGETAPSELADATRPFATRSFLRNTEFSTGIVQFDLNQAVIDALNENPGPFGLSLELSGVLEGTVSLRNPGRLILQGDFTSVPLPAPVYLLLCCFTLLALQRGANSRREV